MSSFNIKKLVAVTALGLFTVLGTSELANAQGRRNDDRNQRKIEKQQEKIRKAQEKIEQQRQAAWNTRNTRMNNERTMRDRRNGNYNNNNNVSNSNRYRVYRNGSYYNTDSRGAELLRQAVNEGYRQGFTAGRSDRNYRRNNSWSNSNVYRSGSVGYQSHVNRSQYQYYFQQGFQRGYQDGSNSRYQNGYNGSYEYGSNENGTLNILGTILNQVLNIQNY